MTDKRSASGVKKQPDAPTPLHNRQDVEARRSVVRGGQLETYMQRVLSDFSLKMNEDMGEKMKLYVLTSLETYHQMRISFLEARIKRLEMPFFVRWYTDLRAWIVVAIAWLRGEQEQPPEPLTITEVTETTVTLSSPPHAQIPSGARVEIVGG